MSDFEDLTLAMRKFSEDRDWMQFHDPKSLLLALIGEVGELSELFQWLPADDARALASTGDLVVRVGEEMADILLYLLRLADVLSIDLPAVTALKLRDANDRFPSEDYLGIAPTKG